MRIALRLAERGIGNTFPNPSVGCVVVKDNKIIGRGWTSVGGRPHAETQALKQAGDSSCGADVYVTLEPCAHKGETSSCAKSLVHAKVRRVFIAAKDPYYKVCGKGVAILKSAGIEVIEGICEEKALAVNEGFFSAINKKRPFVTLKLATSLDGKIATSSGESKWITCEKSRRFAHMLRMRNDAVAVGIGTVIADDPELTCRIDGLEHFSPIRIVLDSNLQIPDTSKLLKTDDCAKTWIFTTKTSRTDINYKAEIITVEHNADNQIDLHEMLCTLAERSITRLLIEGGGKLAASFLKENLVDKLIWIKAPIIIGGDGKSAVSGLNIAHIAESLRFTKSAHIAKDNDIISVYDS